MGPCSYLGQRQIGVRFSIISVGGAELYPAQQSSNQEQILWLTRLPFVRRICTLDIYERFFFML